MLWAGKYGMSASSVKALSIKISTECYVTEKVKPVGLIEYYHHNCLYCFTRFVEIQILLFKLYSTHNIPGFHNHNLDLQQSENDQTLFPQLGSI